MTNVNIAAPNQPHKPAGKPASGSPQQNQGQPKPANGKPGEQQK